MNIPGRWLVEPLPRFGYARRPHFFEDGERQSVCGVAFNSKRNGNPKRMLTFDPGTGRTIENDPRTGEPQTRRECGSCLNVLKDTTNQ